ncbi:MAG: rubrerythrin family protein [Nitrospirae bacterium]|nr:rubrerythrin family protein [Nitrospirota bacterium]
MHSMTTDNLKAAFSGESQAHMKYLIFADKAEEESFNNIARLFKAIAFAERIHATNHFNALHGKDLTFNNLGAAIEGETYEVAEMYPAFKAVAEMQKETNAIISMHYAFEAEKIHAALYAKAKDAVKSTKDLDIGEINICSVCGHTVVGKAPEKCPTCGVEGTKFKNF